MQAPAARPAAHVAQRLAHWAAERPLSPALLDGARAISFGALDDECARLGAGLQSVGVSSGTRVALMVPPSLELYALAFALFRIGAVPVLVDPGVGWKHLKECLGQAKPEVFIGSPKAHLGRVLGGWGKGTLRLKIAARGSFPGAVGLGALRRGASGLRAPDKPEPGAPAAILFTSGSTGTPKGAVYTQEMLGAQIDALRELFGCRPGQVSVATFPLFGLFDVALGMTVVLPRMDATKPGSVEPEAILGPIEKHGAAQLFGSPALLDRVGRFLEKTGRRIPGLERVLSAGAPVPARVLARLRPALPPGCRIYTPYGATEALPVACAADDELAQTAALTAKGQGVCVGRPAPGVEVRVIAVDDGPVAEALPLPVGQIGEICVRGPIASPAYFEKPEATRLAKIADGDTFWHRMGDLGRFDAEGRLWFCGRKSQRVVPKEGGATLYTACVEGVLDAHPAVRRSALVSARGAAAVVVELEPGRKPSEALTRELAALTPVKRVLFHPSLPVDARHNAKIQREKLAVWAEGKVS